VLVGPIIPIACAWEAKPISRTTTAATKITFQFFITTTSTPHSWAFHKESFGFLKSKGYATDSTPRFHACKNRRDKNRQVSCLRLERIPKENDQWTGSGG
jgi:hypothetical protein